ncbi:MAG: MFS transporter [Armatimonadetes bacterium]|nr:MFS transporter [Armatimonadota bacterium]
MNDSALKLSAGYRRLAVVSAVGGLFSYALICTIFAAAVNQISPICGDSDTLIGWLFRVSMIGFIVAVLLGGRYSDKIGKLPVLLVGCVLMSIGSLGFARVTTYPAAVIMSIVMGAGGGFAEAIAMGIIADVTSAHKRTSIMNYAQVFFAIGAVAGPVLVTWLIAVDIDYWRWAFIITALACVVAAVAVASALSKREERPVGETHHGEWKSLLNDRAVLTLSLGVLLYVAAESGQSSWLARYFKDDLAASAPMAAATVALFWTGIGAGRYFAVWTARFMSDYAIVCLAHALAIIFQVTLLITHSSAVAMVSVVMLGFALGPGWPTIVSRASALHPRQSGSVLAVVVSAGAVGAAIFPPAIGQAADHIGMRSALWTSVALLFGNLLIFIPLLIKNRSQSQAP